VSRTFHIDDLHEDLLYNQRLLGSLHLLEQCFD
jgi:hypothetical protein